MTAERDKKIWIFFTHFLGGWVKHKFNFTPEISSPEEPFLLLSNHASDWDPLMVALSFPNTQMYYVASEHIFRWGFLYRLIDWFFHPISRMKGTTAAGTVMTIMRRIKKGANVAVFAEGNRCWDGCTADILPSTGKLAKSCGGSLITYKLTGGYFSNPRWSGTGLRRGRMHGGIVGTYSRAQLRSMSAEEVNEIIKRDLCEDAYERQRRDPVAFKGRRLAESLETMLYICPVCGASGHLSSSGSRLTCGGCGSGFIYNEYGFIEGEKAVFDNVRDWDRWQTDKFRELAAAAGPEPMFSDSGVTLRSVSTEVHKSDIIGTGGIAMYRDRLVCCGVDMPVSRISGFDMHGMMSANLTCGDEHYEICAGRKICLRKYMTVYNILRSAADNGKETEQC